MNGAESRTRVKICGITSQHDLEIAASAGADAIGLITAITVDSPREIPIETAVNLARQTPPFVGSVLVCMPDDIQHALDLAERVDPDAIQLHGSFAPEDLAQLADRTRVIHAFDVQNIAGMRAVEGVVDAILIDSTDEQGAGGTGRTHDWGLARSRVQTLDVPVVLAGGLQPVNVARAIERVGPYAVDVASGVEGDDGKDPNAVREFVDRALTGGE